MLKFIILLISSLTLSSCASSVGFKFDNVKEKHSILYAGIKVSAVYANEKNPRIEDITNRCSSIIRSNKAKSYIKNGILIIKSNPDYLKNITNLNLSCLTNYSHVKRYHILEQFLLSAVNLPSRFAISSSIPIKAHLQTDIKYSSLNFAGNIHIYIFKNKDYQTYFVPYYDSRNQAAPPINVVDFHIPRKIDVNYEKQEISEALKKIMPNATAKLPEAVINKIEIN